MRTEHPTPCAPEMWLLSSGRDVMIASMCAPTVESATLVSIDPLPSLSKKLKWEGPLSFRGPA